MANKEDEIQVQTSEEERSGTFMGPEGVLMLSLAIILDVGGLSEFIPIIGTFFSFLSDIIGLLVIGGWMFFRSQSVTVTGRAAARVGKMARWARKMKWLRPLCFILEFIPIVGILPLWTVAVYFELKQ